MTHLTRHMAPKNWPVHRKGTKYVVKAKSQGVPLLFVLRDMLKIAQNRKEVKKALHLKNILINNKIARDEKNGLLLFDTVTIVPSKKYYRLSLSEKGKFIMEEINEKDSENKISKIINKKTLKGKRIQINLSDGRNFISDLKCNIGDSVLINFKSKKVEKYLNLKEKVKVIVLGGKHAGVSGVIEKIKPERKMVKLKINEGEVNVLIKQIMAIE